MLSIRSLGPLIMLGMRLCIIIDRLPLLLLVRDARSSCLYLVHVDEEVIFHWYLELNR